MSYNQIHVPGRRQFLLNELDRHFFSKVYNVAHRCGRVDIQLESFGWTHILCHAILVMSPTPNLNAWKLVTTVGVVGEVCT